MDDTEERILEDIELQPCMWWRYNDDKFFIWEYGGDSLKRFTETLNAFYPIIKFKTE